MSSQEPNTPVTGSEDGYGYCLTTADLSFLQIPIQSAGACIGRVTPLGLTVSEYRILVAGLAKALLADKVVDADIRIQGSSTHLYSSAHKAMIYGKADIANEYLASRGVRLTLEQLDYIYERLRSQWPDGSARPEKRRPFDAFYRIGISSHKSDFDFQVSSDEMVHRVQTIVDEYGTEVAKDIRSTSPTYGFIRKELVNEAFPTLFRWQIQQSTFLRRGVTVALFDSHGPPEKENALPGQSSHFQESDWVLENWQSLATDGGSL